MAGKRRTLKGPECDRLQGPGPHVAAHALPRHMQRGKVKNYNTIVKNTHTHTRKQCTWCHISPENTIFGKLLYLVKNIVKISVFTKNGKTFFTIKGNFTIKWYN